MSLKARIDQDLKDAMRAKDENRLQAIRLLRSAIQRREVDERITLDDTQVLAVIDKLVKQSRDAVHQFEAAGRTDLAAREHQDLAVWGQYLPAALTPEEIPPLIEQAIVESQASGPRDLGKVMSWLKPKVQGRADLGALTAAIKARLGA